MTHILCTLVPGNGAWWDTVSKQAPDIKRAALEKWAEGKKLKDSDLVPDLDNDGKLAGPPSSMRKSGGLKSTTSSATRTAFADVAASRDRPSYPRDTSRARHHSRPNERAGKAMHRHATMTNSETPCFRKKTQRLAASITSARISSIHSKCQRVVAMAEERDASRYSRRVE